MVTVIIGENSSGKTLFLRNKYFESDSVVTNMDEYECSYSTYSKERLDLLGDYLGTDVVLNGREIVLTDPVQKPNARSMLFLQILCLEG